MGAEARLLTEFGLGLADVAKALGVAVRDVRAALVRERRALKALEEGGGASEH